MLEVTLAVVGFMGLTLLEPSERQKDGARRGWQEHPLRERCRAVRGATGRSSGRRQR